eukprot:m.40828 g.40828  ORF g.40828 m.40828 type:complete len:75 (-) comp11749_c0_seq3:251-475(-)
MDIGSMRTTAAPRHNVEACSGPSASRLLSQCLHKVAAYFFATLHQEKDVGLQLYCASVMKMRNLTAPDTIVEMW